MRTTDQYISKLSINEWHDTIHYQIAVHYYYTKLNTYAGKIKNMNYFI